MNDSPEGTAPLHFATDIRPLFRDLDRTSMLAAFDLWKHPDVVAHQDAILHALESGGMPCDGAWPAARVAILKRWITEGSQP